MVNDLGGKVAIQVSMGPGGMGKAQRHGRREANEIAELLAGIMYGYVRVICFSVAFWASGTATLLLAVGARLPTAGRVFP